MKIIIIVAMMFVSAATLWGSEPPAPSFEQVRSRYPSRAQLQGTVDHYKNQHGPEFASAKADFDLGIRSMLSLEIPVSPAQKQRHGGPRPGEALPSFFSRETVLGQIEKCTNKPGYEECLAFYQQHIDEISVDDTPALRMVCVDVLLNCWSDWSNWQTEKLQQARNAYPDLHVEYALRTMQAIKCQSDLDIGREAVGPAFELVLDRSRRSGILQNARLFVGEILRRSKDVDALRFSLDTAMHTTDKGTRMSFLDIAGSIGSNLDDAREFWVAYLDAPDEYIRTMAVNEIVEHIRKPRPGEPPLPRDAELAQMLRNVAQNDPSPRVRQFLQPRLEYYEASDTRPSHVKGKVNEPLTPLP